MVMRESTGTAWSSGADTAGFGGSCAWAAVRHSAANTADTKIAIPALVRTVINMPFGTKQASGLSLQASDFRLRSFMSSNDQMAKWT